MIETAPIRGRGRTIKGMKPAVLRALLVIVLLSVQLATVAIVLVGMRHQTVDLFAESAQSSLDRLASTVVDQTQRFLAPAEDALDVARDLISEGVLNAGSDRDLERFFLAQLRTNPKLRSMYIARADGSFLSVLRNEEGFLTRQIAIGDGRRAVMLAQRDTAMVIRGNQADPTDTYDPRKRPWYQMARSDDALIWAGAYSFLTTNMPGITAAIPARQPNGTDAGVLGIDVDIVDLSAFLARLSNVKRSTAVVLDDSRHAIAFSEIGRLTEQTRNGMMPTLNHVAGKPLRALFALIERPGTEVSELASGLHRFNLAGEQHVGFVQPFNMADGRVRWLLMVQAPAAEFASGMSAFFSDKLRTLIAVIIVPAVIAVLAVFGLTEPVYRLHEDATIDRLTRALTRSEFERRLAGMLRNRRENENEASIVMIALDLDGFKQVNDWYGHSAGDAVLQEFVSRLRSRLRQTDLIGRTGGDEFLVALRIDGTTDMMRAVEAIRRETVARLFSVPDGRHLLGVTAGVACAEPGESMASLLSRADQALITGKAREKNRSYRAPDRDQDWPQTGVIARREWDPAERRAGESAATPGEPVGDRTVWHE